MKKVLIMLMIPMVLFGCSSTTKKENDVNDGDKTIKVNQEFELGNVNIEIQTVKVKDDSITVPIWWSHWASNNKVHLTALAYPVVKQDGEELKEIGGGDSLLKQKEKGVDGRAKVTYELIDNKTPVEIKFKTTDDDPEEESITVELE